MKGYTDNSPDLRKRTNRGLIRELRECVAKMANPRYMAAVKDLEDRTGVLLEEIEDRFVRHSGRDWDDE